MGAPAAWRVDRDDGDTLCRDAERVSIRGDNRTLSSLSVRVVGVALHELATNAAKYGALSTTTGHVDVSWQVEPTSAGDRLRITWSESGGPPVVEPSRRGLGTVLIEEAIAYELAGKATIQFLASGVRCEIIIPVPGTKGTP